MANLSLKPVNPSVPAKPKANIPGTAKPQKTPKMSSASALFGPKKLKPALQSTPTKMPAL